MRPQLRSRVANGLDRTRLLGPAERVRESWLAMRSGGPAVSCFDELPLPPARLRLLVDGRSADPDRFLAVGSQMSGAVAAAAADAGQPLAVMSALLDFGCGCGRVARHWSGLTGPELHGCDYNPDLVEWCEASLPFLSVSRNRIAPPTHHVGGSFDLIYAFSVLSHLSEPLQQAWVAEFSRLLRPGGMLVISVLGHAVRHRLGPEEGQRFDRGELVVQRPRMAGSNVCSAYHPGGYVRGRLLAGFADVGQFDLGSPRLPIGQDAYLAIRGG
jgi:SAM-dependent methyltransferase